MDSFRALACSSPFPVLQNLPTFRGGESDYSALVASFVRAVWIPSALRSCRKLTLILKAHEHTLQIGSLIADDSPCPQLPWLLPFETVAGHGMNVRPTEVARSSKASCIPEVMHRHSQAQLQPRAAAQQGDDGRVPRSINDQCASPQFHS